MTDEDKINKWIEEHNCEDYCEYCINSSVCDGRIVCYGDQPIFPPCAEMDILELLDTDALLKDIEGGIYD
jgi:hypothetical protein